MFLFVAFAKKINIRISKYEDIEAIVEIYNQAIAAGKKTADIMPFSLNDQELVWRPYA